MNFEVPRPREIADIAMADGAVIRVRRHGNGSRRVVISHGNGFAVDAYFPFWKRLLDDYEVVVFDLRDHGHNPRHLYERHTVSEFVDDFEILSPEIVNCFGKKPTIAMFHSISAITSIVQNLDYGPRWDCLLLVDPPVIPLPGHALYEFAHGFEVNLSEWANGRQEQFSSPDELTGRLASAKSKALWVEGSHDLMARSILRRNSAGNGWELACPGRYEAQIYACNAALNIWNRLTDIGGPIKFVGADPDLENAWPPALINRAIHQEIGHPYVCLSGTTHMIHVEKPDALAKALDAFAGECGLR